MQWSALRDSVLCNFIDRSIGNVNGAALGILENPTEEIIDGLGRGKAVKLFAARATAALPALAAAAGPPRRLEQNYLYATRAFQAGAMTSGDFRFFQNAIGQPGTGDGFPAGIVLSDLETNMDVGGQIAQGKNFVFNAIGISFNSKIDVGNLTTLMDAGSLKFSKQGDQYLLRHGPARLWPGGTGASGFSTATSVTAAHNGIADPKAVRSLKVPRVIKEKESFSYIYSVPRTTQGNDGSTAFSIVAPGALMTVWLWGGQMDRIPG